MLRSLGLAIALTLTAGAGLLSAKADVADRSLPMHFDLRLQGSDCGAQCKVLISASGSITADSGRDFEAFAKSTGRDLRNATVVLDSDGGSVHGAIDLGRAMRRLGLNATVGHLVNLENSASAKLSPRADCESMCAFVLLGGVHRLVPQQARVMVHQIWLGDRREDPTAANYSAEDLVLVQRDIGRLAIYAADMGASAELLDLSLRIPPWEPMHVMTSDELRNTRLATDETVAPAPAVAASSPPPPDAALATPAVPRMTNGSRVNAVGERRWSMTDRDGVAVLARRYPLTAAGEEIGSFDLIVSCGAGSDRYDVTYIERRGRGEHAALPAKLGSVLVQVGAAEVSLKVSSSERQGGELLTHAAGQVKAAMIDAFAAAGHHSMTVATRSDGLDTVIRLGNTGTQISLPQLAKSCQAGGVRAELAQPKTGQATGTLAAP